jgi:RHS repeat-associated protein
MTSTNRYLFSGKEKQTTAEINYMDFGSRMYDDFLGRWFTHDPQSYRRPWESPYGYCGGNPVVRVDPDGEFFLTALLAPIGLAPLGAILDGTCWGAVIGGASYTIATALSSGGLSNWNSSQFWQSVGIGAVSGAVFSGMSVIAPEFSVSSTNFLTNLPTYLYKAGYAALSASVSSGAGMLFGDWIDDGRINNDFDNYLKGMGIVSLSAGLTSFASSMYQYATWDRLSYAERAVKLETIYGVEVQYNPGQDAAGKWNGNKRIGFSVSLNKDGLSNISFAKYVVEHELKHINTLDNEMLKALTQMALKGDISHSVYRNYSEIMTHTYSLKTAFKHYLSARDWLNEVSVMRKLYKYNGHTPSGLNFLMFLLNFR